MKPSIRSVVVLCFCGLAVGGGCRIFDSVNVSESLKQPSEEWQAAGDVHYPDLPTSWIEFTPDGKNIVAADDHLVSWYFAQRCRYQMLPTPGRIRIWKLGDDGSPLWVKNPLNIHYVAPWGMGRYALVDANSGVVISRITQGYGIWNLESGQQIQQIDDPENSMTTGVVSSDRSLIIWPSETDGLIVHNLQSGDRERYDFPDTENLQLHAFSPDDQLLVGSRNDNDGGLKVDGYFVTDWKIGTVVSRLEHSDQQLVKVKFSPDGNMIAGGTFGDGILSIWEVQSGRRVSKREVDGVIWSLAFSPNGRFLAVGAEVDEGKAGAVYVWDVKTWKRLAYWKIPSENVWGVTALAFSPDGTTLAVGRSDGRITFRSVPDIESASD